MDEIKIPLNPNEVKKFIEARAFLKAAYMKSSNTLASLTEKDRPDLLGATAALTTLKVDCDTLSNICTALEREPVLIDEHVEDLIALQETLNDDMFRRITGMRIKISEMAKSGAVPNLDANVALGVTHDTIHALIGGMRRSQQMFDVVNEKLEPLGLSFKAQTDEGRIL